MAKISKNPRRSPLLAEFFFHFGQVSCVFPFATRKWVDARSLSQIPSSVATSRRRNAPIIWNQPKITLPLLSLRQAAPHQSKASFDCIRFALSLHSKTSCSGIRVSFLIHICIRLVIVSVFLFCPFDWIVWVIVSNESKRGPQRLRSPVYNHIITDDTVKCVNYLKTQFPLFAYARYLTLSNKAKYQSPQFLRVNLYSQCHFGSSEMLHRR